MKGGRGLALATLTIGLGLVLPAAAQAQRAEVFNMSYRGSGDYSRTYENLPPDGRSGTSSGEPGFVATWRLTVPVHDPKDWQIQGSVGGTGTVGTTGTFDDPFDLDSDPDDPFSCTVNVRGLNGDGLLRVHSTPDRIDFSVSGGDTLTAANAHMPGCFEGSVWDQKGIGMSFTGLVEATSASFSFPASILAQVSSAQELPTPPTPFTQPCLPEAESCTQSYTLTSRRVSLEKVCRTGAARLSGAPPNDVSPEYICASDCYVDTCDDGVAETRVGEVLQVGPRGIVRVPTSCYGRDCRVAIAISAFKRAGPVARRRVTLARRRASIAVGETSDVRLRLGPRMRRLVPPGSEVQVRGAVRLLGSERAQVRSTFTTTLKAPRRYRR